MRPLIAVLVLRVLFSVAYAQDRPATDWAWDKIRAGQIADFNHRCGELDPRDDAGWDSDCRRIPAKFLQDVLTDPVRQADLFRHRVGVWGARIDGTLDLVAADINAKVWINASRIEGDLFLADSRWTHGLSLDDSRVTGTLVAERMHGEGYLSLQHAAFNGEVILRGAKIDGQINMSGASLAKRLTADSLSVGQNLLMGNGAAFGGDVNLNSAVIRSSLDMAGAKFARNLEADSLSVGQNLFMGHGAAFSGEVVLRSARIGGQLSMIGASLDQILDGNGLSVGQNFFMRSGTFRGDVDLVGAKIGGQLDMAKASFSNALTASGLTVEQSLIMRDATFGDIVLGGAKLGDLFLEGATVSGLNLVNAVVAQELNLRDLGWRCPAGGATAAAADADVPGPPVSAAHWRLGDPAWPAHCSRAGDPPLLVLRNAHAGNLQDSEDAWPPALDLEGFRYDRLGGWGGKGRRDMRARSPQEWTDWLARDPTFSTQSYVQLASVLQVAGHRDSAEAIQYASRQRERGEALARGDWEQWAWLTTLWGIAGYGIGLYTFRVLWWVFGLTVLGAVVLWFSPNARRRGLIWRLGASLHRLLPVLELNREFKEFFDNPVPPHAYEPRNLNRFQAAFFAGLAIAGWILGIFLIAALGGLMPKS